MANVVKTVHRAEIITLFEGACDQMNHTKETSQPSTRTLCSTLQNY